MECHPSLKRWIPTKTFLQAGNFISVAQCSNVLSFLDLIKLALPLKQSLYYIIENETYTTEINVSKIKFYVGEKKTFLY